MKKIVLLLVLIVCLVLGCTKPITENNYETEVYFSPETNLNEKLGEFMDSANKTLHCALYDMSDEIAEKLVEKSKTVDVKLIMDDENRNLNGNGVKVDSNGLMHDKFCIIDDKKVWTGSFNPTKTASLSNNNVLIIYSSYAAKDYSDEFFEMWNGNFKGGSRTKFQNILLNNKSYNIYFCPENKCAEKVLKKLESAEKSIYFMAYSFTRKDFADVLIQKNENGVDVKGIIEKQRVNESYGQFNYLYGKIQLKADENKYLMHHKVFIIDEKIVATGSFNPTYGADKNNDENLIIIEDENIAKLYLEEFDTLYQ